MVEGRHRREDHRPEVGGRRHQAQVAGVERRLAHGQHERPPLLQHHVRRAQEQVVGVRARDPREGLDRAGRHDHRVGAEGAARDGRADVADAVHDVGECAHVLERVGRLEPQRQVGVAGGDEVRLDVRHLAEPLEQAHAVHHAGAAGDPDDEPHRAHASARREGRAS